MPSEIGGVPLHPLVVHAVVVLIPLAATGLLAISVVPRWRARYGVLVVTAALVGTALVPVATTSGEELEDIRPDSSVLERHTELGETALWGAIALLLVSVVLWWWGRRAERNAQPASGLSVLLAVPGVVVGLAVLVQFVLIGHSGADAVWGG